MTTEEKIFRHRTGLIMSITALVAGSTGFFYQFMADGTFLTILVTTVALMGFVENRKYLDERDSHLLDRSYSTAFIYLFFAILLMFMFQLFFGRMQFAVAIINVVNAHWVGIMASIMCILIGVAGIRSYREIR